MALVSVASTIQPVTNALTKWEYKLSSVNLGYIAPLHVQVEAEQAALTAMGADNWELVTVRKYDNGALYYWKRPAVSA